MAYGNGLSGNQSLAYVGTSANQPPNWTFEKRDPTIYDINSNLGDLWMNLVEQTAWILVSLQGSPTSRGPLATWLEFGGGTGDVVSLTGNTGGRVYSTLGNINVIGDGVTTTVSGDPSTNTLTISTSGLEANSFPTDSGTATPASGVLNINGGTGVVTSAPGDTNIVEISIADGIADQYDADSGTATPSGNTLNIYGGAGITTSAAGDTVTITAVTGTFPTDSGTATPFAGVLNINAIESPLANCGSSVQFTGSGNTVLLDVTDSNFNTIMGDTAGSSGPTGVQNTSFGALSSFYLTTGTKNTAIGYAANFSLPSGSGNIAIGNNAGNGWLSNESGNICIGSVGGVGDNHVLRIGSGTGSGTNQLLGAKISGIDGVNVGSVAEVVTMGTGGNADQLGTAVLTAGPGITITPSANIITITSTAGGFTWNNIVAVGAAMLAENGYVADAAGLLTFTLPTNSALGDSIKLMGKGSGGWTITYGANQNIIYGKATTTTTTGSLSSTNANDCVELICSTASVTQPIFTVFSSIGNLSII